MTLLVSQDFCIAKWFFLLFSFLVYLVLNMIYPPFQIRGWFQADPPAAELFGAVGQLVEKRREECSKAVRGKTQLFKGGQTVSVKVELLQVSPHAKTEKESFVNVPLFCCSSMVIRDLTLRSAASFGSFHLIRLLYDEYMFYLIEHQVAEATGIVPIAVMVEGIVSSLVFFHSY